MKHRNDFTDMFRFFVRCAGWLLVGCSALAFLIVWGINKLLQ